MKAYAALAGIPYVGPTLAATTAGVIVAGGLAKVAIISSQTLAEGGIVKGHSPHSKADNIPIWGTQDEFMQPVSAVKYYGLNAMEAIRKKLIPREALLSYAKGVSTNKKSLTSYALAEGGVVPDRALVESLGSATEQEANVVVNNFNIVDPNTFSEYLSSTEGHNQILNIISTDKHVINTILQGV